MDLDGPIGSTLEHPFLNLVLDSATPHLNFNGEDYYEYIIHCE